MIGDAPPYWRALMYCMPVKQFRLRAFAMAALCLFSLVPAVQAQGSVVGWVIAASSKAPIPRARVTLAGTTVVTCTGLGGRYVVTNIAPGMVQLRIVAMPYAPATQAVTVSDGAASTLELELTGVPDGDSRRRAAECRATSHGHAARRVTAICQHVY